MRGVSPRYQVLCFTMEELYDTFMKTNGEITVYVTELYSVCSALFLPLFSFLLSLLQAAVFSPPEAQPS